MALLNRFREQLTAQNVFLDENTGGKGKYFKARFLQPGLVKYSFGVCVLEKDTIDKFINEFVGCPVIIGHKDVTNENAKKLSCGNICHIWYDESDGWYWGDGIIDDEEAINKINQGYNVSCQYEITEYSNNTTNALHNGNPYDKVILNGKPEHLAIVDRPRYENAMIAMNALDLTAENEDKWVTIKPNGDKGKGRHLLIKDGENVYDAMQRQWGVEAKGQQHLFDRKKYKTDTNYKDELRGKLAEHLKQVQKRYDNLEYLGVAEPDKLKDEDYEDISFEEWEYKQEDKKEEKKENNAKIEKIAEGYKDYFDEKQMADFKKELAKFDKYKGLKNIDIEGSKETIKKLKPEEALQRLKDSNNLWERFEKEDKLEKQFDDYVNDFMKKNNLKDNRIYELRRFIGGPEKLFIDKIPTFEEFKKDNRYNFHTALALKYLADKKGFEHFDNLSDKELALEKNGYEKFIKILKGDKAQNSVTNTIKQAINEIKETDMFNKLFNRKDKQMEKDEMKSLFIECLQECLKAKNEEDKKEEEKEAENKCKNEVVDKRDIIRQIMAIAGKEEASEDVKTIAKLAEKLAYDKSEADDKADNCKGKNEDKEEEDKEEAKNKSKNAIEEMKAMFSQTEIKKAASNYVTRDDAIALGNELF